MKDGERTMWRDFWAWARALWLRATAGSIWRQRVFAGGAALGLLLIISGVALAALAPSDPPQQRVVVAQATDTATIASISGPGAIPKMVRRIPSISVR